MALLDDLKGILSEEEYAKLASNETMATRLKRGDELRSYYDGDAEPATPPAPAAAAPPAAETTPRTPPSAHQDIAGIEAMLDSKLKAINQTIETKLAEAVKQRGDELYNNVRSGVRNDALQLVKMYTRHQQVTGREWDDAEEQKFNEFLTQNNEALKTGTGKQYRSLTEAYNDYIAPTVQERTINTEVDKRVAERTSGQRLPGTTPGPAISPNLRVIMQRGRTAPADGQPATRADRAASALDKLMARQQEAAS